MAETRPTPNEISIIASELYWLEHSTEIAAAQPTSETTYVHLRRGKVVEYLRAPDAERMLSESGNRLPHGSVIKSLRDVDANTGMSLSNIRPIVMTGPKDAVASMAHVTLRIEDPTMKVKAPTTLLSALAHTNTILGHLEGVVQMMVGEVAGGCSDSSREDRYDASKSTLNCARDNAALALRVERQVMDLADVLGIEVPTLAQGA